MPAMPAAAVDLREASKAERVYEHLRRRIRELALPPGAPLRKEEIALELGVSRAPVSEAIARLAEEGLVEVFPQHGSFVAPIRAADVRESLFIRTALETEAMRRLAPVADAPAVRRARRQPGRPGRGAGRGDLARFYDLDEALHALIFAAAETPRALSACSTPPARRSTACAAWRCRSPAGRKTRSTSTAGWSRRCAPATPSSPPPPCACTSPGRAAPSSENSAKMEEAPARRA